MAHIRQGLPYSGIRAPFTIAASSEQRYKTKAVISSGVVFILFEVGARSGSAPMERTRTTLAVAPVPLSSYARDCVMIS